MPDGNLPIVAADGFTPDPFDVEFGARIRLRRRMLGHSQTDLADAIGVTFQQVQKYERGANRVSASMIKRVAAFLDTPVAYLFGDSADAPPIGGGVAELLKHHPGQVLLQVAPTLPADRLAALARVAVALAPQDGDA